MQMFGGRACLLADFPPLDPEPAPEPTIQGAQLSQDIKKTQSMLSQTNQQLTEYVEKYTRQVASPFPTLPSALLFARFPSHSTAPFASFLLVRATHLNL